MLRASKNSVSVASSRLYLTAGRLVQEQAHNLRERYPRVRAG